MISQTEQDISKSERGDCRGTRRRSTISNDWTKSRKKHSFYVFLLIISSFFIAYSLPER